MPTAPPAVDGAPARAAWHREVDEATDRLGPDLRLVLVLVYRSAMSHEAVAAATSLPLAGVRTALARGLQDLAADLGG